MLNRFSLTLFIVISSFFVVHAQEDDSLTTDYLFQRIFDSTLTDNEFIETINNFHESMEVSEKPSKRWHRGQTYYDEVYYKDSIQTFNSETFFNSLRSELYVNQLLYRGKVIRKVSAGGEGFSHDHMILAPIEQVPNKRHSKRKRNKAIETHSEPESISMPDTVNLQKDVALIRMYTETYYNHDLNLAVTFTAEAYGQSIEYLVRENIGNKWSGLNFKRKYLRLIAVSYSILDPADLPYVFIENH